VANGLDFAIWQVFLVLNPPFLQIDFGLSGFLFRFI